MAAAISFSFVTVTQASVALKSVTLSSCPGRKTAGWTVAFSSGQRSSSRSAMARNEPGPENKRLMSRKYGMAWIGMNMLIFTQII
jgi:hypothetical protein